MVFCVLRRCAGFEVDRVSSVMTQWLRAPHIDFSSNTYAGYQEYTRVWLSLPAGGMTLYVLDEEG